MKNYNATARIEYIDIAKGILIVLVVLGHITTLPHILVYGMKAVITSFHMPAFFIISGMLTRVDKLQKTSVKQFLLSKSRRLLIPYVFFEVTGGLWQMLLMGTENVNIRGILCGIFTIHCHVGADWFLPTLFFAEICIYFLAKLRSKQCYPMISGACFLIAFLLTDITYFVACCRRILIALAFTLIGMSFKKLFAYKNLLACAFSGMLVIVIAYVNGVVDLANRQFGNHILYLLGSLIGTYFILCISQYIFGFLAKLLGHIGRSSLTIMGTHQNIQIAFNVLYGSVFQMPLQCYVYLITAVCEIIIVYLCERFVPFWVGKPLHTSESKKSSEG